MNMLAATLRGSTIQVPSGTLQLTKAQGGPLRANIGALRWDAHPVTVGQWERYINKGDQLGGRFGLVVFNRDMTVNTVVRGHTREDALANSYSVIKNLLKANALSEDVTSIPTWGIVEMIPTLETWRERFSSFTDGAQVFLGKDHPAVCINWFEALGFANAAGARLPTEVEWHFAALGGQAAKNVRYATASNTLKGAIWDRSGRKGTAPVIAPEGGPDVLAARRNAYGLVDMTGNVWEWQANAGSYYYRRFFDTANDGLKTLFALLPTRGGSWNSGASCLRVGACMLAPANDDFNIVGFRCVS